MQLFDNNYAQGLLLHTIMLIPICHLTWHEIGRYASMLAGIVQILLAMCLHL